MKNGFTWPKINWEAIATITAIGGLYISIFQTCQNNTDSKIKDKRDSTQIAILTETFKQGQEETKRVRQRDFDEIRLLSESNNQLANEFKRLQGRDLRQTALFAEGNQISKHNNEILERNYISFFQVNFWIEDAKPHVVNPTSMRFMPAITFKNIGRAAAQHTYVSYFVVTIDNYSNVKTYSSNLTDQLYRTEIGVGKTEQLVNVPSLNLPLIIDRVNRDSLLRLKPALRDFSSRFTYLVVMRIRSVDRPSNVTIDQFAVRAFNPSIAYTMYVPGVPYPSNRESVYKFDISYSTIKFSMIEGYVKKHDFNFNEMKAQLGDEYNYVKTGCDVIVDFTSVLHGNYHCFLPLLRQSGPGSAKRSQHKRPPTL